jgi:hypothetical protein
MLETGQASLAPAMKGPLSDPQFQGQCFCINQLYRVTHGPKILPIQTMSRHLLPSAQISSGLADNRVKEVLMKPENHTVKPENEIPFSHPTLLKVKELLSNDSETNAEYWRRQALDWWKHYLRNRCVIAKLRSQNRALRLLLSDYMEVGTD